MDSEEPISKHLTFILRGDMSGVAKHPGDTGEVTPIRLLHIPVRGARVSELHRGNGAIKCRTAVEHAAVETTVVAKPASSKHQIASSVALDIKMRLDPVDHRARSICLRRLGPIQFVHQDMLLSTQQRDLSLSINKLGFKLSDGSRFPEHVFKVLRGCDKKQETGPPSGVSSCP